MSRPTSFSNALSELLTNGFALETLTAGEHVETCYVMPPQFCIGRPFCADLLIINLAYKVHGLSTARWSVFTLNLAKTRHDDDLDTIDTGWAV